MEIPTDSKLLMIETPRVVARGLLILTACLMVVLASGSICFVRVSGRSLWPLLEHGDLLIALRLPPWTWLRRLVLRVDRIVLFTPPVSASLGSTHIKRIDALSGSQRVWGSQPTPRSIPPEHVFLVGTSTDLDPRRGALDSRGYGPCPYTSVIAMPVVRIAFRRGRRLTLLPAT